MDGLARKFVVTPRSCTRGSVYVITVAVLQRSKPPHSHSPLYPIRRPAIFQQVHTSMPISAIHLTSHYWLSATGCHLEEDNSSLCTTAWTKCVKQNPEYDQQGLDKSQIK